MLHTEARIVAVALAIGLDVLALSTAIGIKGPPWSVRLRLGASFAAAELLMQVAGLLLGTGLGRVVGEIATWSGLFVLALVGIWILREGFSDEGDHHDFDVSSPAGLAVASLSISLDSLGVGFALLALKLPLAPLFTTVAISTVCFTVTGLAFGAVLGHVFEKNAERGAGIVLLLLSLAFAYQHLHG